MCMTDYDAPDFYFADSRKARKEHKCDECRRAIRPGEVYQYVSGKWDGRVGVYKTCLHCEVTQKWLRRECHGFVHGMTAEDIEEHASDYRRMDLYRLAAGMRRKWLTRKGERMKIPAVPRGLGKKDADRLSA